MLWNCQQVQGGLLWYVQAKMIWNILLDFGIGLVPLLGDMADVLFHANMKNGSILEKHLRDKSVSSCDNDRIQAGSGYEKERSHV